MASTARIPFTRESSAIHARRNRSRGARSRLSYAFRAGMAGRGVPRSSPPAASIWIADRCRAHLEDSGLATFDQVMATTAGRCLRVLAERENWYLQSSRHAPRTVRPKLKASLIGMLLEQRRRTLADDAGTVPATLGMYLKKHRTRTWRTRLAAALGFAPPASAGRIEADNARALESLGVEVMPLAACGEKLCADGWLESFLLTEELAGYCELQEFIQGRFSGHASRDIELERLILQVAGIARRFHAAGFNHRDFYCCHFLVKETSRGCFDVRLIDLQRAQRRRWFRRRWIVKDLAQLASMSPDDCLGCREKVLFLRSYLGVPKLRRQDKRLIGCVLGKLASIRRHARKAP